MLSLKIFNIGAFFGLAAVAPTFAASESASCRCLPEDDCWPSVSTWNAFNQSVDGRLVATVPLATPCHVPTYNEKTCAALKEGWLLPEEQ
jgi:hypothetical protein